ncbi:MAG: hypothetical protein HY554_18090 [Elusimicrobia bacterium]|nr:hypothetical protein [Elusimicrobiota bacterium]
MNPKAQARPVVKTAVPTLRGAGFRAVCFRSSICLAALIAPSFAQQAGVPGDSPTSVTLQMSTQAAPVPVADGRGEDLLGRGAEIRVLESFRKGYGTRLILQSKQALVTGQGVYVGVQEIPATLGDLLSVAGGLYYYVASASGKVDVKAGDRVLLQRTRKLNLPAFLAFSIKEGFAFDQKHVAEVTAVQGDRAMIDRGTLHEVHERDLYRIFDSSGGYKGLLEVRGIGDLQSSGLLHNRWEDRRPRALETRPGDAAVFVGQRRLLGLGLMGGSQLGRTQTLYAFDHSNGGGILWNITFYNGWGLEVLFGVYRIAGGDATWNRQTGNQYQSQVDERIAEFMAPTWLKKNFFYPSICSPFAAAGFTYLQAKHRFDHLVPTSTGEEIKLRKGLIPVLGAGIEFFPVRFFRPRFEVRHFFGPRVIARGNIFRTESTFYSVGVMTAW